VWRRPFRASGLAFLLLRRRWATAKTVKSDIRIGRLFGVQIALHLSWFVIAFLLMFSLSQRFRELHVGWSAATVWTTASATALLFFVTLVLHELSHALVARSRGLPVRSITLFALGGVAEIEKEAGDPATEFWMGIAGPLVSLAIGLGCLSAAHGLGWVLLTEPATPALAALVWLGYINVSLALFNLIPAFPMDGGRILRALLWRLGGDVARATRAAARVSQIVAVGLILLGLSQFLSGAGFGGLWIGFIGWFLLSAAGSSYGQADLKEMLRGIRGRPHQPRGLRPEVSDADGQPLLHGHEEGFGGRADHAARRQGGAPRALALHGRRRRDAAAGAGEQRLPVGAAQRVPRDHGARRRASASGPEARSPARGHLARGDPAAHEGPRRSADVNGSSEEASWPA